MKRIFIIAIAAMAVFATTSCDGGNGDSEPDKVTITFNIGDAIADLPEQITIEKGKSLGDQLPAGPNRGSDWQFDAWYVDLEDLNTKVLPTTPFYTNTTIYARWDSVIKVNAVTPVITNANQPASSHYIEDNGILTVAGTATTGMAALTVTATVTDGGTLSYQWFKADNAAAATEGTVVTGSDGTGGDTRTFTPSIITRGTYYFYAVATNTKSDATGEKTATRKSNTATIRITGPVSYPPNVTIGGVEIVFNATAPEKGKYGTAFTGTQPYTSMGYAVLKDTQYAKASVSFGQFTNNEDSIKVLKMTIPNTRSYSISPAPADSWEAAGNTLTDEAFTGKDVIQIQHTRAVPPGTTGVNAAAVAYYTIYIRRAVEIPYLANAASALQLADTDGYTAAIPNAAQWDNAARLIIDRPFMDDSPNFARSEYDLNNPPVLKLLWSDDGLYFYLYVTDGTVALEGGDDHQVDNLELFISEDYNWTGGNWNSLGGQYRIARSGAVTGDSTARVKKMVNSTATGYTLMGSIAWAEGTTAVNGKMVGFDPQLAYCFAGGTRDACILWNSFMEGSYQNKTNAGILLLK